MKNKITISFIAISSFIVLFGCLNPKDEDKTQIAVSPPMGFNSYDSYVAYIDQETVKELIDVMSEKYLPFGYGYFVVDGGWYYEYDIDSITKLPRSSPHHCPVRSNIDKNGLPEPSQVYFPDGIKILVDYAHQKGLKFGLHLMRGVFRQAIYEGCKVKGTDIYLKDIVDTTSVCSWSDLCYGLDMSKLGAYKYYESMIDKMKSWGVDFIKYDDITGFPEEIAAIAKAVEKYDKNIILSLSPGLDAKMEYLPWYEKSNMLRTTDDIWDNQQSIDMAFNAMKKYQGYGHPGFWPDLDMIALGALEVNDLGGIIGATGKGARISMFDKDQAQTFITQRAIFASPLFIGGDLLTMDNYTYGLLTNKEMLACNQNGVNGFLVYEKDSIEIYKAPKRGNVAEGWFAIFNRKGSETTIKLGKPDFGFYYSRPDLRSLMKWGDYKFKDIWNRKTYTLKDSVDFKIPANGVVFTHYKKI